MGGGKNGDQQIPRRGKVRRFFFALFLIVVFGAGMGIGGFTGVISYFSKDLPQLVSAADYRPKQVTRVYSRDGRVIGEWFKERRTLAPFETIPEVLRNAVIAAEDANFYSHQGLDYPGIFRAALSLVRDRRISQGGSTITQQVVKTFLLTPERKFARKIRELILARRLEQNLTKDEILYLYLNQIYFGHGCYGVEEASRFFFDKGVEDVTVLEAALLAGLPQAPEGKSPIRYPEAAIERRTYVLERMAANGYLSADEAAQLYKEPLQIVGKRAKDLRLASHFVEHVRRSLVKELGEELVYEGGLRVQTTLDASMQEVANGAVILGLDAIDQRKRFARPLRQLKTQAAKDKFYKEKQGRKVGLRPGVIVEGLVIGVDEENGGYEVALDQERTGFLRAKWLRRYVKLDSGQAVDEAKAAQAAREAAAAAVAEGGEDEDEGAVGEGTGEGAARVAAAKAAASREQAEFIAKALQLFKPGDVIRVGVAEEKGPGGSLGLLPEFGPQGVLVAMEPGGREVVAMVGGDPRLPGAFNRVTQAQRQPGSSFKPVIYSAALESKRFTAASVLLDSPEVYLLHDGTWWTPQNYDQKFRGSMRLRQAVASSVNMIAIRVLADVGIETVIDYARRIGIEGPLDPYLPMALGSSVMTPIDLTNVYAVWASGGYRANPVMVREVISPSGVVLYRDEASPVRAIPEDLAYMTTDLLSSVTVSGTASRVWKELKRPAAGKTGTTNDLTDTWFVAYVPSLVTAVWIGFDDNKTLGSGEQGSRTTVPMWIEFMQKVLGDSPVEEFAVPSRGIEYRMIDPVTGQLASPGTVDAIREKFLTGTAPMTYAPLPGESDEESFLLDQAGAMDLEGGEEAGAFGFDDNENDIEHGTGKKSASDMNLEPAGGQGAGPGGEQGRSQTESGSPGSVRSPLQPVQQQPRLQEPQHGSQSFPRPGKVPGRPVQMPPAASPMVN